MQTNFPVNFYVRFLQSSVFLSSSFKDASRQHPTESWADSVTHSELSSALSRPQHCLTASPTTFVIPKKKKREECICVYVPMVGRYKTGKRSLLRTNLDFLACPFRFKKNTRGVGALLLISERIFLFKTFALLAHIQKWSRHAPVLSWSLCG